MKVLIVHNVLWSHYKSALFRELQRQSAEFGATVHVLQIARNERARAFMEASDNELDSYQYELLFDDYLENVGTWAKTKVLVQRLLAYQPDVLNLTGYYDPAVWVLLLLAKWKGIRVVMQNESTPVDNQRSGPKEWFKRQIMRLCDGFMSFGTASANYLLELGVRPEQLLVRHTAVVDNPTLRALYEQALPARFSNQQTLGLRPHNFIFVGRLAPEKNLSRLIDAFSQARQWAINGADWGLLLLGGGPEKPALETQIAQLNQSDAVHLLPGRSWKGVPAVLALADVLVLPSLSEPWGLVVNEAMVCGMPVVVSDRCGCAPDLVQPGQNGYRFDPLDTHELAAHLLLCMNEPTRRTRMGQVSEQLIAPYSPTAVARAILEGFVRVGKPATHQTLT